MAILELGIEINGLGKASSDLKGLNSIINQTVGTLDQNIRQNAQYSKSLEDISRAIKWGRGDITELRKEQEALRSAIQSNKTAIRNQINDFNASDGSLVSLRSQLNLATKAYDQLTKSERENAKVGGLLVKNINSIQNEIKAAEQATGRFQRSVGNYQNALRGANGVNMEFNRIIQDAPFGMMGIGNNIQQLAANWQVYSRQAKEAAVASGQTMTAMGLLKGVATNFLTTGNLLTFGIAAITSGYTAWTMWQQKANKSVKEGKSELESYKETMNSFQQAQLQAVNSYGQEIARLGALFKITQDVNSSVEERKNALSKLQEMYPTVFKNLDIESVKTANASKQYNTLRNSIIATAKAQAAFAKIGELAGTDFTNSERQLDLSNEYTTIYKTIGALKTRAKNLEKEANSGVVIGKIYEQIAVLEDKANDIRKKSLDIQNERTKTSEQQNRLAESAVINEKENTREQEKGVEVAKEKAESLKKQIDHLKEIYSLSGITAKDIALVGSIGIQYDVDSVNYDLNQKVKELQAYQATILRDTSLSEEKRKDLIAKTNEVIKFISDRALIDVISMRDKYSTELSKMLTITPIKTTQDIEVFGEIGVPEWLKESKKLTKELTREITNIIGMLPNLSGGFYDIFSQLTSGIGSLFQKELINNLSETLSKKMKEVDADTMKIAGALTVAGQTLQGLFNQSSVAGQGIGGALSGAGTGLGIGSMISKSGGIWGAAIGGVVGLVSGIFGGKKKRKEEERQRQQLEEQKKTNALLERMNALAYTSSIIGGKTTEGIVTGVNRNEFGEITFRIEGKDLVTSLSRQNAIGSR